MLLRSLSLLFLLLLPTPTAPLSTPPIAKVHILASSSTSPFGTTSPVSPVSFHDAALAVARKVQNCDPRISVSVSSPPNPSTPPPSCDLLLTLGLDPPSNLPPASSNKGRFVIHPPNPLQNSLDFVDSFTPPSPSLPTPPWSSLSTARRMHSYLSGLFTRHTTDDFAIAILLFVNQYSDSKVPWVQHSIDPSWEKVRMDEERRAKGWSGATAAYHPPTLSLTTIPHSNPFHSSFHSSLHSSHR